ncbi:hypothetical protein V8E53_003829 [Lactarius tabidus]
MPALEYKISHKVGPQTLPKVDLPWSRSAEEVVNILYNMPPPAGHVLSCLVQNEPTLQSHVPGVFAGRGFDIDSFLVCCTEMMASRA